MDANVSIERDEIAKLIGGYTRSRDHARIAAEEILDAGYRRPRNITTSIELESLPAGTVVRSEAGTIAARFDLEHGVVFGDDRPFPWNALALPAIVLYTPEGS